MIKFLRWLFGTRREPIMRGPETVDAWDELQDMGYEMKSSPDHIRGLRNYWIEKNGIRVTEVMRLTVDASFAARRIWSVDELARVLELEGRK